MLTLVQVEKATDTFPPDTIGTLTNVRESNKKLLTFIHYRWVNKFPLEKIKEIEKIAIGDFIYHDGKLSVIKEISQEKTFLKLDDDIVLDISTVKRVEVFRIRN